MTSNSQTAKLHHVVIVGGGFGGLCAARSLANSPVEVTLIDRRNFHLFQPLLYQVATGALSPANIASPLRTILKRQRNTQMLLGEVTGIDLSNRKLSVGDNAISYDTLIVATGVTPSYFGHDDWADTAPSLKSVEDALAIRTRILTAFEMAEREKGGTRATEWLTFVIVGGGPTGVELAGALAEIARYTLRGNFQHIDPAQAQILLVEATDRLLPGYPRQLSAYAAKSLAKLGVTILTGTQVVDVQSNQVVIQHDGKTESVHTHTCLWAAGMQASPLGQIIGQVTHAGTDRAGRIIVQPDLSVPSHPEVLVIGDLAHFSDHTGKPLPGLAPVAMQQGRYAAHLIKARLQGKTLPAFQYRDHGRLSVIGRTTAVADFGWVYLHGFIGWLTWLFVHLVNLIEFENRLLVLIQWAWSYLTYNRSAQLIVGLLPPDSDDATVLKPLLHDKSPVKITD